MLKDFKAFVMRGNVVDMAVGIVIGGAFSKIVSSFVNDVLMPPIGLLVGGVDFADLAITLQEASGDVAAVTVNYGSFIQTVIDFVIIAFAIFMVVKAMNNLKKKEEAAPPAPKKAPPAAEPAESPAAAAETNAAAPPEIYTIKSQGTLTRWLNDGQGGDWFEQPVLDLEQVERLYLD